MGKTDTDLRHGLDQIRKNLLLINGHYDSYPCPFCLRKHWTSVQATAEEIGSMGDKQMKEFLLRLREIALEKRQQLGDVLAL